VEKSTVPVGTGDTLRAHIEPRWTRPVVTLQFDIVSNPEVPQGRLGGVRLPSSGPHHHRLRARRSARCDARPVLAFNRNHDRIMFMDLRSAELTKYAANCMLATKISFINQIAELAEHLGADIESVRLGIGADSRIGYHFIYPGCGYGGSCFPKDMRALIHSAKRPTAPATCCKRWKPSTSGRRASCSNASTRSTRATCGQDLCPVGPGVQAQHRRHARCAEPRAAGIAVGGRRQCACVRPRSDAGNPALYPMKRS
jgi:nucleotide sugar dehydrogenase